MPRYVKQTNRYTCGPIAIANTLKWAGIPFSWKMNGRQLIHDSGAHPSFGSEAYRFHHILQKESGGTIRGDWRSGAEVKNLDEWLNDDNHCAIVIVHYASGACHTFLCTDVTNNHFTVVNLDKGLTCRRISRKKMAKLLDVRPDINQTVYIEKTLCLQTLPT